MPWTLQHDATTQSLEAWGMSNARLAMNSFAPSTLTVALAGPHDADSGIAEGDAITLRDAGNVVRFKGRLRDDPGTASGNSEARALVFEDVLGDLNRRILNQSWPGWTGSVVEPVQRPVAVLFGTEAGPVGISAQIAAIIAAAAAVGIAVQCGSSGGITAAPQVMDISSMTYLEVLKVCVKYAPDTATRVDYTTTPPTVNFIRRASGTVKTLAVVDGADEFEFKPLYGLRTGPVVLSYSKTAVVGAETLDASYRDVWPAGSTGNEEGALVIHKQLKSSRVGGVTAPAPPMSQAQQIETVAISATSFDFWERLWPEIAGRNVEATLTDGDVSEAGYRMITNGAQPDWIGSAETVTVTAVFSGVVGGVNMVGRTLTARVNASTLTSGTYSRVGSTGGVGGLETPEPGEWIPTGLAQTLHEALSVLQWSCRHTRADDDLDWGISLGDVVNFTGTTHPGLLTAKAQVQSVVYDIDSATRTVNCGPGAVLKFDDFIELTSVLRSLPEGTRLGEQTGTTAASALSVLGAGMGPGFALILGELPATHPFQCRHISGNLFRVEAGSFGGFSLAAATINVGGSRPVSIIAGPTFTTVVWNGEYIQSAVLATVPALAASSAIFNDVQSITAAGNQARCVIAKITAGNVVGQMAVQNVIVNTNDAGTTPATAAVQFIK